MAAEPYALADKTIAALNHSAMRRFKNAKSAMLIADFDELTVLQQCKSLYKRLKKDNDDAFYDLYVAKYLEVSGSVSNRKKTDDALDELIELYISGALIVGGKNNKLTAKQSEKLDSLYGNAKTRVNALLSNPNPITGYSYENEIPRKRERCEEAVNAASGKSKKQTELDKALRFWSQMTGQYADNVNDDANITALKEANVKYVRWNTQEDERVCGACDDRNGKIYRIDRVPDKPHWRCRCWLSPVSEK